LPETRIKRLPQGTELARNAQTEYFIFYFYFIYQVHMKYPPQFPVKHSVG
jgi:hypothetical protein